MTKRIYLSPPHLTGRESQFIQETLESNWPSVVGPYLDRFSSALSTYTKISHISLNSSGTASLQLALSVLDIGREDIVLTSTFTFVASVNPISYLGAIPILIESEPDTWNMSPQFLEEAIKDCLSKNKKPKAILLVHLYGMPAKLGRILKIAQKYDIPLIEDAAESLGSRYKDQQLGGFGILGVYSFNGNKVITTGSGGALVSKNDKYLIDKATFLASQAKNDKPYYEHSELGYNYQMTTLNAAMGMAQIKKIDEYVALRRRNFEFYKSVLKPIGISFLEEPTTDYFSNRWITTICLNPKLHRITPLQLKNYLDEKGIESRLLWKPMHKQPLYKHLTYFGDDFSGQLFGRGLCLPSGSNLNEIDLVKIVTTIKHFLSIKT
jgi:dTDP-4-amino-4,6-dideoxygalactose transaminase